MQALALLKSFLNSSYDRRQMTVAMTPADQSALSALEQRIKILLPEQYQNSYEEVQPTSMVSAGLKFAPDLFQKYGVS